MVWLIWLVSNVVVRVLGRVIWIRWDVFIVYFLVIDWLVLVGVVW